MTHESDPVLGRLAGKLRVNDRMAHGVLAILIDSRVQGREIFVEDMLVGQGVTVGSHGFGPSTEEGVSGIKGRHQIQGLGPQAQFGIFPLLGFPLALPLFDQHVAPLTNAVGPLDRARVQFVGRGLVEFGVPLVTLRNTFGAPVVEATVEFVHKPGAWIVAVPVVAMFADPEEHLPSVTTVAYSGFIVRGWRQDVFQVVQPFQGDSRLTDLWMPAVQRFHGQGSGTHPMAAVGHVAGRGDGDTLFEGVEPANAPEFALEEGTRLFQDPYVGLTVFQQFGLQVKDVMRRHLLCVPSFELGTTGWFHAVGIVIMFLPVWPPRTAAKWAR